MQRIKTLTALIPLLALMGTLGCASTRHHEGTGSRADIKSAVRVASAVNGVKSVTNDMQLK